MNKLTPRDLFNPPPQAGEVVGDNGRHEPTRFVFQFPVPAGETLRSSVSIHDGVRTVIGEIPRRLTGMSDTSLNTLLNIAAGGYRLTGICEGCKGTGFTKANYDPCVVVGCISRTDERVKALVGEGKIVEAIRLHRSLHNTELIEAKQFIDTLRYGNV